jgi:hypothetical protein
MDINQLECTCSACPSQWEFRTFENRPVYVRYRWGYLSVRIGAPNKDIMDAVGGIELIGEQLGDDFEGVINWSEVEPKILALPNFL